MQETGTQETGKAPARPPRTRQPPHIRRQMITEAARTVIAGHGLHATTLRDVAAAADVALGTVTYHFTGIDEVLAEVLKSEMLIYSAPITDAAQEAATGRAGLDVVIDGLLASDERAGEHWRLWLDFWTLAAHNAEYSAWQSQIYRDLHAVVAGLLRRGHADGSLTVTDPVREAVEFVAMLDGLVVQSYLRQSQITPDQARAMLKSYAWQTMPARD
ncbi:TetR family transcriptional regulator [Nakamurella silvestris]|nr:TetR family transcriptional regulator [Nakamurella silvestris]